MEQPTEKFTTPLSLVVDLVLLVAFFVYMAHWVLPTHVPSNNPKMILLFSVLAASCMTGVFWLALQMFRVVFRAYRLANK